MNSFDTVVKSLATRRGIVGVLVALIAAIFGIEGDVDAKGKKPCPKPKNPCKRSVRRNGKCRRVNRKNGTKCGAGKTCKAGKCRNNPVNPCDGITCTGGTVCENGACVCRSGDDCTLTVNPDNMQGWVGYDDGPVGEGIDNSVLTFVTGPGDPPNGDGSVQISVTGEERFNIATYQFSGTGLSFITELKFATYNPSAGNGGSPNRSGYLHFNVDFDGSDTWQRRLVFVPQQNGTVTQDAWQEWDAIQNGNALWTLSGGTWPIDGLPNTTPKTWQSIITQYSGVRIRVTDSFLGIRVGEPYLDGYTENIDSVTFGTVQGGTKVFNFEPL